jgi:Cys-tRNA(Pro)/Cys-tRNA(Cys) deacylase
VTDAPGIHLQILRALGSAGVPFEKTPFDHKLRTVAQVAAAIGLPESRIAKALLVAPGSGPMSIVTLPGHKRLDLKQLAAQLDRPSARLVRPRDVSRLVGVEPGAITPLLALLDDHLEVAVDMALLDVETVNVSSGAPWLGLNMAPAHLLEVTGARRLAFG